MARRITKSAIDWAKFIEFVPKDQTAQLASLRAKNEGFLRAVLDLPEVPPAIDFSFYKSRIANPKLVEEFEQKYKALQIPYPEDKYSAKIDVMAAEGKKHVADFIAQSKARIESFKKERAEFDKMIPLQHMTYEDFDEAYPEQAWNPDKPTWFPHDQETQERIKEGEAEEANPHANSH